MIEVSHLTKRYGDKFAVNDISFTVNEGEIVGFLGPNGAGKSTTMNILTGYLSSNQGKVCVAGADILEDPSAVKRHIGYLPEQPPLYQDMTVREYLNFVFELRGVKYPRKAHIDEVCGLVRIQHVASRVIKNLSKGYKQRVGLAQALIGNPDVLVLDEPTVGLDPKEILEILSLIKSLGKKHTVILSSHILSEVESICERIIIIKSGEIVADDTTINLSRGLQGDMKLVARVAGPYDAVRRAITGLPGVSNVTNAGVHEPGTNDYEIETKADNDVRRALFNLLADRRWPLLSLDTGVMSLEKIFLRLTADESVPTGRLRVRGLKSLPKKTLRAKGAKADEEAVASEEEVFDEEAEAAEAAVDEMPAQEADAAQPTPAEKQEEE